MSAVPIQRVVFVPASGPRGSGEAYRALNLAQAIHARRPDLGLHVLLDARARMAPEPCWTVHELEATPARAGTAAASILDSLAPVLAVFDGSGRTDHLRRVRRAGGRVAWVSNRPSRRRRGYAIRRARWIDLHLLVGPGCGSRAPGVRERWIGRLAGVDAFCASAIAPDPAEPAGDAPERPFAVFVPGGGGQSIQGRPVSDRFVEAARRFHDATAAPVVVVLGPQYAGAEPEISDGAFRVVRALPTERLGALLARAGLLVTGAGNMLSNQVLLAGRPCVMTATGGHDQPGRLAGLARAGAVDPAPLDAAALAGAAIVLWQDPKRQQRRIEAIDSLGVVNDTGEVADRLLALLER